MTTDPSVITTRKKSSDAHLRSVDLNLLTVFDAVMQTQNVTRAARALGMSQPAVSNAIARLKVMFDDELFVRCGRGIQPTTRAHQLFGPVRQALQSVHNELPSAGFEPQNSDRVFNLSICSPLDIRLAAQLVNKIKARAPTLQVIIKSYLSNDIEHKLRYQHTDFVIGYNEFKRPDFCNITLFHDELILAASNKHPRIQESVTQRQLSEERHAVVSLENIGSFSAPYYVSGKHLRAIVYQGTDMNSVLRVVSQTDLITIAPKWLVQNYSESLGLRLIKLPVEECAASARPCFLTWNEATNRDRGHQWMKKLLNQFTLSA